MEVTVETVSVYRLPLKIIDMCKYTLIGEIIAIDEMHTIIYFLMLCSTVVSQSVTNKMEESFLSEIFANGTDYQAYDG